MAVKQREVRDIVDAGDTTTYGIAATRKLLRKLGVDEAMVAFDDFKI